MSLMSEATFVHRTRSIAMLPKTRQALMAIACHGTTWRQAAEAHGVRESTIFRAMARAGLVKRLVVSRGG